MCGTVENRRESAEVIDIEHRTYQLALPPVLFTCKRRWRRRIAEQNDGYKTAEIASWEIPTNDGHYPRTKTNEICPVQQC